MDMFYGHVLMSIVHARNRRFENLSIELCPRPAESVTTYRGVPSGDGMIAAADRVLLTPLATAINDPTAQATASITARTKLGSSVAEARDGK
jgi:hypothetical protein